ncbi:MAG: hypothetical protein J6K19_03825 [Prevotella sp.]|nr:hypothetical protein [Prevotella sp.]
MNNQEYEQKRRECWKEFLKLGGGEEEISGKQTFVFAFDRAYALGKQEKDADTVIQGWVARDMDGYISLFQERPTRDTCDKGDIPYGFGGDNTGYYIELPTTSFPDLTWESEPLEVEIIIKRKKNG